MKTTQEKDKATARPWRIVETDGSYAIWSIQDETPGSRNNYVIADGIQSEAEAILIVKAVNQFEALNAVAIEAAFLVREVCCSQRLGKLDIRKDFSLINHREGMKQALTNLAALRKAQI